MHDKYCCSTDQSTQFAAVADADIEASAMSVAYNGLGELCAQLFLWR